MMDNRPQHIGCIGANCPHCEKWHTFPPHVRANLTRTPGAATPLPCLHLGDALTGVERSAAGLDSRNWTRCEHPTKPLGDVVCACKGCGVSCSGYEADAPEVYPAPSVRHLLYHVYPRRGGEWRKCLLKLRERVPLFNGRRVVAVAHDGTTEHPVMVEDALNGLGCEFVTVPNNPERREVETFRPLFDRVADLTGPEHCTLYGHAKGVTRPVNSTSGLWGDTLAELSLDYWPRVSGMLRRFPVVGSFKKLGRGWRAEESASEWHYSGSWFWFRNRQLFTRPDWTRIDQFWSGIEPYPSLHFAAADAGCLFHPMQLGQPSNTLYSHEYWRDVVLPALERFRAANTPPRPVPNARQLNLGCGPHYQPGWCNVDVERTAAVTPDVLTAPGSPLPFDDAAFDRAYLGHVLEHLPWETVPAVLADVRRVVKPGGSVLVVGPDQLLAVRRLFEKPSEWAARHVWECGEHREYDAPPGRDHHWNCTGERVADAMRRAGFADVRPLAHDPATLAGWPVMDFTGAQCAVMGVAR